MRPYPHLHENRHYAVPSLGRNIIQIWVAIAVLGRVVLGDGGVDERFAGGIGGGSPVDSTSTATGETGTFNGRTFIPTDTASVADACAEGEASVCRVSVTDGNIEMLWSEEGELVCDASDTLDEQERAHTSETMPSSSSKPESSPEPASVSEAASNNPPGTPSASLSTSTSSSSTVPDSEYDPDSPLDAALFLSFEEWKKRQAPEQAASSGSKKGSGGGPKKNNNRRPGVNLHNALDALGDDAEIEWTGFGRGEDDAQAAVKAGEPYTRNEAVEARAGSSVTGNDSPHDNNDNSNNNNNNNDGDDTSFEASQKSTPASSSPGRKTRSSSAGKTCKERFNYASFDCGATVLKTNAEAKNPAAVLVEHKDSYMLNECAAKATKFLVVEMCADILVDTVVLANYEFFSSIFRRVRVGVSDRYPPVRRGRVVGADADGDGEGDGDSDDDDNEDGDGNGSTDGNGDGVSGEGAEDSDAGSAVDKRTRAKKLKVKKKKGKKKSKKKKERDADEVDGWRILGTFEARNVRGIQAFAIENPLVWARYVRIEFLEHYGSEFYCPVSLLRVHGTTMMEEFRHQQEEGEGEGDGEVEVEGEGEESSVEDEGEVQGEIEEGGVEGGRVVLVEDDGDGESADLSSGSLSKSQVGDESDGDASTHSAQEYDRRQEENYSQEPIKEQQLSDTSALALRFSNLTIDQLLGIVNNAKEMVNNASVVSEHAEGHSIDSPTTHISTTITATSTNIETITRTEVKKPHGKQADDYADNDRGTSMNEDGGTEAIHPESDADFSSAGSPNTDISITDDGSEEVSFQHGTSDSAGDDVYAIPATPTTGTQDVPTTEETVTNGSDSSSSSIIQPTTRTHSVTQARSNSTAKSSSSTASSNSQDPSPSSVSQQNQSSTSHSSASSQLSVSASPSSTSAQTPSPPPSQQTHSPSSTAPTPTRPAVPNPTTQESFFKTVHKRLQMLETNSSLSLQYIEEQSRILRDAFLKVEKRQSGKIDDYFARLSGNMTDALERFVCVLTEFPFCILRMSLVLKLKC